MPPTRFRDRLESELRARREKNARYSLRAFAAHLGTDHSTLSQILRGARGIPIRQLRSWAKTLGFTAEETAVYVAAEHVPDDATAARQQQLRHWTAEAIAIVTEPAHWEIVRLARAPGFRPDSRWIAAEAGLSADAVNVALSRLLRLGLLEAVSTREWKDLTGAATERSFRKLALQRVREKAAENQVRLPLKGQLKL
jgi:transcriptional regulator with XRE-family HTH domain